MMMFVTGEGWKGLPLGNGTLGAMVWHPNALFFQLNTSWGTVLGSSPGRVRLRTSPGLLSDVPSDQSRCDSAIARPVGAPGQPDAETTGASPTPPGRIAPGCQSSRKCGQGKRRWLGLPAD